MHPTTWTVLQKHGPNHLESRHNELPEHQMALITSGCVQGKQFHGLQLQSLLRTPAAAVG